MTRINLVDAYDNRSVVSKLVSMEERISGAEKSVEASAEAAASSASAAADSQTAAKTSATDAKASADEAAAVLSNTVDLSSKQTITGAKTFAGDTAVTGSLVTSGNTEMAKLDIDTGKFTVGSGGSVEIHGALTADNPSNSFKGASHDSVLTGDDILTAKDIMTVNGGANNLVHRSGEAETISKLLTVLGLDARAFFPHKLFPLNYDSSANQNKFFEVAKIKRVETDGYFIVEIISGSNNAPVYGRLIIQEIGEACWIDLVHGDVYNALSTDTIHLATTPADDFLHIFVKQVSEWGTLMGRLAVDHRSWLSGIVQDSHFVWLEQSEMVIYDTLPSTMTEVTIKAPYQE